MIVIGNREISAVRFGEMAVNAVYRGAALVWQAVSNVWHGKDVWKENDLW